MSLPLYRDSNGRFSYNGNPVTNVHNQRDSTGKFIKKSAGFSFAPTLKQDSAGRWRNRLGHFASSPNVATAKANDAYYTAADLIDAIEKNGYPQVRGHYISKDANGKVVGACAIGQGALNLKITTYSFRAALASAGIPPTTIISLNDHNHMTIPQIVARVRQDYGSVLNRKSNLKKKG